jgi:hypothetical protein
MGKTRSGETVEQVMARIASGNHGSVTRAELLRAGITVAEIKHRIRCGALLRERRGVYRVGHAAPSREASYMGAVRVAGAGTVLSGLAAAHLFSLIRRSAPEPEVTAPRRRRMKGLRATHSDVPPDERTIWLGIPVTSVARTLVDIAGRLTADELARAVHEASVRYGTTPERVERVLQRRPRARGAATLRRILRGDIHVTLSELERRFLELLRDAGLPLPDETNALVGEHRVDCRWRRRVTVELDSFRFHNTRYAFEQDRRREHEAHARGDHFRRYTYGDVIERPELVIAELEPLLLDLASEG